MTLKNAEKEMKGRRKKEREEGRRNRIGANEKDEIQACIKYAKLELVSITSPIIKLKKFPQCIKEKYAEHGVIRYSINGYKQGVNNYSRDNTLRIFVVGEK